MDLIERASHKIDIETIPKLIQPIKRALYTHNPTVISRVLIVLQRLARGNDGAIGIVLVPHFNQLLPIINIIRERHQGKTSRQCQTIDDFDRDHSSELVRLIDQTLFIFEQFGGQDAFINIKYSIPTYEQQADVKALTSTQMDMMMQPLMPID